MSVLIPIAQDGAHFSFSTELDGVTYGFELRWNKRAEAWFLTLSDGEGDPIVAGIKVVLSTPLLTMFRDTRLPTGFLFAFDTGGTGEEAGWGDLGRRVVMSYYSASEL